MSSGEWIAVGRVGDIADQQCLRCDIDDEPIAVYNLGGEYFAIEDRCSHDDGELADGWVDDGCAVCPRHGARFDIRTGRVMAPPAYEDIHSFALRVVDGVIEVRDDRD
ncbi:non-heme iron oxygenase ferredoxin subunit [Salinisphaera sp.]|uniref:non-heme iron oxygenase ferredoxin subunit n=1 Tax=Salinisphaera sp. TaxID=1914330 RepID=UPI000C576B67|nr:non-heme iron oxygenase ferredoxin subunit [Salinisphaera sp.]MBS62077.1 ferredoxin [Salinisphaera sp.]